MSLIFKRILAFLSLSCLVSPLTLVFVTAVAAKSDSNVLKLGILPSESPVMMFQRLAPLREYLSLHLKQPVNLETARDFQQFIERSNNGEYDILLTAPHLALLAYDSGHYDLIASFYRPLSSVFVVNQNSHLQNLDQVTGLRIATAPEEAIVTMVGKETLKNHVDINSINFQYHRNHGSAFLALRAGDADIAIIANLIYRINRNRYPIRVIGSSQEFPGVGVLVAKNKSAAFKSQLSDVLTHMRASTDGLVVLKKINQPGYSAATIEQFEGLRRFIQKM